MNKPETKKLLDTIKGYYNSQFFIDEYVTKAWIDSMEPYDLDDAIEHLQKYLKERPDVPPKPHTFKQGLYTHEEKMRIKNSDYTVECNMCHRWMSYGGYEEHYERCLLIKSLLVVLNDAGQHVTEDDLEKYDIQTLSKVWDKYVPLKKEIKIFD